MYTFLLFSHYICMKNTVSKGAIILIVSGIIGKIFGALFRLPLTNILGIAGIGGYQMVMSLYSLTLGFVAGGVTTTLSKLVSSSRARGDYKAIGGYYRYALLFSLSLSLLFGLFFALFSQPISSLQGFSDASISYKLLALLLPLGALIGTYRGIIQGYENMAPTAISQVIEQSFKFAFGLIFAYIFSTHGIYSGVFGAFLGITISEVLATLYLAFIVIKKVKLSPVKAPVRAEFFKAVLPLSFSGSVLPLAFAIESLIITSLLLKAGFQNSTITSLYGLQSGVVGAILHFPLVISLSASTAMLPKISYLSSQGDDEGQKTVINKAFSIIWFLLIPLVVGIISISRQLYPILYSDSVEAYLDVAQQLTLLGGFAIVLSAITQLLNAVLQAKGFYNQSLLFNILGGIFKILSLIFLAPIKNINIYAIAISNIILYSIICICALIKLGKLIKLSFYNLSLPLLASFIMERVIKLWLSYSSGVWAILVAIVLGGIIYILLCFPLIIDFAKEFLKRKKRLNT